MNSEKEVLEVLDSMLHQSPIRAVIDRIAGQVEQELTRNPARVMAWQPITLSVYGRMMPSGIISSWVFILAEAR
jgi:hypothetical protein